MKNGEKIEPIVAERQININHMFNYSAANFPGVEEADFNAINKQLRFYVPQLNFKQAKISNHESRMDINQNDINYDELGYSKQIQFKVLGLMKDAIFGYIRRRKEFKYELEDFHPDIVLLPAITHPLLPALMTPTRVLEYECVIQPYIMKGVRRVLFVNLTTGDMFGDYERSWWYKRFIGDPDDAPKPIQGLNSDPDKIE